ncbi:MAG TPA: MaoC/PaaZ C-terminal domain-containing protein [Candidatus Lokiarchaeia archaeon]|nr:MaoC/PaaZ C-terminal domain-containing protein [Candidatus Lokiarchaeia archaeon]
MVDVSEVKVDKEFTKLVGPSTRSNIKEYAKASKDRNAIHVSDDSASAGGLRGVIQHGMLGYAIAIDFMDSWVGDAGKLKSITSEMRGTVRPGDMMEIKLKIESISEQTASCTWTLSSITPFTISKDGEIVKTFEAEEHDWLDKKDVENNLIVEKELEEPLTYVDYTWDNLGFPKGKWNETIGTWEDGGTLKYRYRTAFQGKVDFEFNEPLDY